MNGCSIAITDKIVMEMLLEYVVFALWLAHLWYFYFIYQIYWT